jgi:hypothetical protein
MIDPKKKRDSGPLDHLGPSGIGRRLSSPSKADAKDVEIARRRLAEIDEKPITIVIPAKPRGRPKTGEKPWEAAGVSKATWFRQRKKD